MRCLMHFVLFLLFSSNAIAQAQLLESIDVVHVVSMTHLDVGYSNHLIIFPCRFPNAINTSITLDKLGMYYHTIFALSD